MIVKNESHIIKETLEKLLIKIPEIDYYVICDTGSEDDTPGIIKQFFEEKNIKGEIYHDRWKDFGHNRSKALEYAYNKSKYLLIFDADDEIVGNFMLPVQQMQTLQFDGLNLQFGPVLYERTLLVDNRKKWIFKGVLHEYLEPVSFQAKIIGVKGNYYIISGRSGARNKDPLKYQKDAMILERAFYESKENGDGLHHRYGFYCAQSFKDANDKENAIIWYKKTLELQGWIQERYWSCYMLYHLLNDIDEKEKAIFYLVKSFEYDTERYECIYELIRFYCSQGQDSIAWMYYQMIRSEYETNYLTKNPQGKLFLSEWCGAFGLPYYMIIASINTKNLETTKKLYNIIFEKKWPENNEFYIGCLFTNYKFIHDQASPDLKRKFYSYIKVLSGHLHYPICNHMDELKKYGIFPTLKKNIIKNRYKGSQNILIYCGYSPDLWNHTYYKTNALGGSETAAMELALNLPSRFQIYIIGGVMKEKYKNIQFIEEQNAHHIIENLEFFAIIVSRFLDFFEKFKEFKSYQFIAWAHDTCFHCDYLLEESDYFIDHYICMTEWHKDLFIKNYPTISGKIKIINNGIIDDAISSNNVKIAHRFIYSSCPERGLKKLLELWKDIQQTWPTAELYICGYNATCDNDLGRMMKEYSGIKFIGKVNKSELYKLMDTSEYWLYPTDWHETSCITAMEMMAHKVLCLYYPIAGLPCTIKIGCGIQLEKGNETSILFSLTREMKQQTIQNAINLCENYKWSNHIQEWNRLLGITI
jgi:glycosyltransferase involved in cell wall biosynthesis